MHKVPGDDLVHMSDAVEFIAVAIAARTNGILHGIGGYGKTMFATDVREYFGREGVGTWYESLNIGTDEIALFGGLSPAHVKEMDFGRPAVERSWIQKELVFFDEMLDANARVLCALKDTITAQAWRRGDEVVPSRTRTIIGLTNQEPKFYAKDNPSVDALLDRFPLQLNVHWPTHDTKDYEEMFNILDGTTEYKGFVMPTWKKLTSDRPRVTIPPIMIKSLTLALGEAQKLGAHVSPRTAVVCRNVLLASARINGRFQVEKDDFRVLRFVAGISEFLDELMTRVEFLLAQAMQELMLKEAREVCEKALSTPGGHQTDVIDEQVTKLKKVRWVDAMKEVAEGEIENLTAARTIVGTPPTEVDQWGEK